MLSWASSKIEKLSEAVAPPPTDASSKYVYCIQRNDEEGAMAALQELHDPSNTVVQPTKGATALHVACSASSERVIRFLLLQPGASLVVLDNFGNTPLHHACMSNSNQGLSVVKMLVEEFKASVMAKNGEGQTPYDVAILDGVRQYLLPLQLQQETAQALANGGVGLPPGIDLGGLHIQGVAPPPIMPATPHNSVHANNNNNNNNMLATPSPNMPPPPQQQATSPTDSKPPMAPISGNREYKRSGSSSAAVYKGKFQPDGFHSSSSDKELQKMYGHAPVGSQVNVAPPPTASSAPTSLGNPYANRRTRYPVYDAVSNRTVTPPHSGNFGGVGYQAAAATVPTPPHSGNVFNPAAPQNMLNPTSPYPAQAVPTPPHSGNFMTTTTTTSAQGTPAGQVTSPQAVQPFPQAQNQALPEGWTEAVDPNSGRTYYVNAAQNLTTWDRPAPASVASPALTTPAVASPASAQQQPVTATPTSVPQAPLSANAQELFAGPSPEKQLQEQAMQEETQPAEPSAEGKEAPVANDALAQGWTEVVDPTSGRPYYFNAATNVTTWERPVAPAAEEPATVAQTKPETKSADDVFASPSPEKQETTDPKEESKNAEEVFATPSPEKQQETEQPAAQEPKVDTAATAEETTERKSDGNEGINGQGQNQDGAASAEPAASSSDPAAAAAGSLPEGWTEVVDPTSGRPYYHNSVTNETTWERPTVAPAAETPAALPEGWVEVVDPASGRTYYCNVTTHETSWERPAAPVVGMPVQQPMAHVQSSGSTVSAHDVFGAPSAQETTSTGEASKPDVPESTPSIPNQQPVSHVQSNASAEDVFAAPSSGNLPETDKPVLPEQRSITEETAKTSASSAAELFGAPASAEPAAATTTDTNNTTTAAVANDDNGVAEASAESTAEEPSSKSDSVTNGGETAKAPTEKAAVADELNANPSDSTEEMMSEVPLDETPIAARPEVASQGTAAGSDSLFTAIGLPPPPFRSGGSK